MKAHARLAVAGTLALAFLAVPVPAQAESEDRCLESANAAIAEFSKFPDGVPATIAAPHVDAIYATCYAPAPSDGSAVTFSPAATGPVDDTDAALYIAQNLKTCSGGGSTVIGWSNTFYVLGERFHLLNEPASSYFTYQYYVKDGNTNMWAVDGHLRSAVNNVEFESIPNDVHGKPPFQHVYWDWLNIPMAGSVSASWNCLTVLGQAGLITSTTMTLTGTPLAEVTYNLAADRVSAANDQVSLPNVYVLVIEASGTTCTIPC